MASVPMFPVSVSGRILSVCDMACWEVFHSFGLKPEACFVYPSDLKVDKKIDVDEYLIDEDLIDEDLICEDLPVASNAISSILSDITNSVPSNNITLNALEKSPKRLSSAVELSPLPVHGIKKIRSLSKGKGKASTEVCDVDTTDQENVLIHANVMNNVKTRNSGKKNNSQLEDSSEPHFSMFDELIVEGKRNRKST